VGGVGFDECLLRRNFQSFWVGVFNLVHVDQGLIVHKCMIRDCLYMREAKSIPEGPGKAPGPGHLRDGAQVGNIHLHHLRLLVEAHLEKSI
jgi:hypothetical protein